MDSDLGISSKQFKASKFGRLGRSGGSTLIMVLLALVAWYFGDTNNNSHSPGSKQSSAGRGGTIHGGDSTFDYYSLVLSWSPTHCLRKDRAPSGLQCNSQKSFSFVLHGLWPQKNKGWPEFCKSDSGKLDKQVISSMLDIMPARGLVKHQYKKHGTCTGLSAEEFFDLSRNLFDKVQIPEKYNQPSKFIVTNGEEIQSSFIQANPGLTPAMVAVNCQRGNENRLKEVKVCFNKAGSFAPCGKNEKVSRLCRGKKVTLPPARG